MLLRPADLYAVPAMCGALVVVIASGQGWSAWGMVIGASVATALRMASLQFNWHLPMAPRRSV